MKSKENTPSYEKIWLKCPMCNSNPYLRMLKDKKTDNYSDNLVKWESQINGSGKILITVGTFRNRSPEDIKTHIPLN